MPQVWEGERGLEHGGPAEQSWAGLALGLWPSIPSPSVHKIS